MPYITQQRRTSIANGEQPGSSGELNYQLTQVIRTYLLACGATSLGITYATLNDIIGALDACKLEFYRRVVVPYEERKRVANGDIYDF